MEVFGSSGVRGVANELLTPEFVVSVAKAAGTVWDTDRAAVGRDTRTTGALLADAAGSGLASVGVSVDKLGITPTPAVQAYAAVEAIPAIVVTASHNPPKYNGVKLIGADGNELSVEALETVEQTFLDEAFDTVTWEAVGEIETVEGVNQTYVDEVLAAVDRDRIAEASLTVAVDPGHGAGALTSPDFFRELGCSVVTVNAQPDGRFPGRDPEPVADNLEDLQRLVRAAEADLGIAHDGDADRAIFIDETGTYIEGDAALAALARRELVKGTVAVSAINVSQRLVDVVKNIGARLELTPIGSTRIMSRINELQIAGETVPIAGEGNGGIVFPDFRIARDGAYTAARFLELITDRSASEVIAEFDAYHNERLNIEYESDTERQTLLDAADAFAKDADAELSTTDGYRLDFGNAWVLIRPSGTEPLIRVYAEAHNQSRAEALVQSVREALLEAPA